MIRHTRQPPIRERATDPLDDSDGPARVESSCQQVPVASEGGRAERGKRAELGSHGCPERVVEDHIERRRKLILVRVESDLPGERVRLEPMAWQEARGGDTGCELRRRRRRRKEARDEEGDKAHTHLPDHPWLLRRWLDEGCIMR